MVAAVVDGTDDEYNDGDDGSNILEMCSDCEVSTSIGVEGSDLQVLLSSELCDQSLCVILDQALAEMCCLILVFQDYLLISPTLLLQLGRFPMWRFTVL